MELDILAELAAAMTAEPKADKEGLVGRWIQQDEQRSQATEPSGRARGTTRNSTANSD